MKLLLVFAAVLFTVSTAPYNEKKRFVEDELSRRRRLLKLHQDPPPPPFINWVKKGAVTSVKDQGQCGSSYAFAAAGALEALFFIQNKTLTDVSVQELLDCSRNDACEGGFEQPCYMYVMNRPGINSNSTYPYIAKDNGKCLAKMDESAGYSNYFVDVPDEDENALLKVVGLIGPVSTSVAVTPDFINYKGGIFTGKCAKYVNHGVLIVGYETDNVTNEDYWLVKNTWGTAWGENGYIRMKRNISICGIAFSASYPIYEKRLEN